jgi:hypothetical protein
MTIEREEKPMTLIYRAEKGAPLLSSEIDGNFKELETRLQTLEEHPETAESLGRIDVQEDQIRFTGTFGTDFGTFTLPKAKRRACRPWVSQTVYQMHDWVTVDHALYECLKEHTSTLWAQDGALWQEVLSLPKPPSSDLALYEKATLPQDESLGKLALLMEEEGASLIFFNGKTWQRLTKGETL